MMRVLIADDSAPVRSALRRLLDEAREFRERFQVTGEAANFAELMRLSRACRPDLILLDWELSGFPGSTKTSLEASPTLSRSEKKRNVILASLRKLESEPKIIVMSSRPEAEQSSLLAGADRFIFKGDPPEHLIRAVISCIEDE